MLPDASANMKIGKGRASCATKLFKPIRYLSLFDIYIFLRLRDQVIAKFMPKCGKSVKCCILMLLKGMSCKKNKLLCEKNFKNVKNFSYIVFYETKNYTTLLDGGQ